MPEAPREPEARSGVGRVLKGGVLALGLLVLSAQREDPGIARARLARDPLPGLRAAAERLDAAGDRGAAAMARELLLFLRPPGTTPPPLDPAEIPTEGPAVTRAEARLAEELRQLAEPERLLLWEMTLTPGVDPGLRARLLRILDEARDSRAELAEAIRRGNGVVAWEAAVRLGRRGDPADAPVLREALRDWRGWGRQYALVAVVLMGDAGALEFVREATGDASPAVRRHAALALGSLGRPEDHARLDQLARSPDPHLPRVCLEAKRRLRERFPPVP